MRTYSDFNGVAIGSRSVRDPAPLGPAAKTILQHLKQIGDISAIEASALYRCRSLSRRITDLRQHGYAIGSKLKVDATGQRYARYTLAS